MSKLEELMKRDGLLHQMPPARLAQLEGEVLHLFRASERHRDATIDEFSAAVLPAVHFNQFRIYHDGVGRPIGWISWACFTDEEARGYMAGDFDFQIDTWIGGPHIWFIDFIAPFGHALKIAEDLKRNVFAEQVAFAPDLEGGGKRIRKFFGARVRGTDTRDDSSDFIEQMAR